jgi:hypothetical protein
MDNRIVAWLGLVVLTILSGVGDSQGFLYASRVWQDGRLNGSAALRSALGFTAGVICYWGAIRFFDLLGITSPGVQTVAWFVVTLAGVALVSGEFLRWSRVDQAVGLVAILAVGLLMLRNGG